MYWILHFWQEMQYIMLVVLQLTAVLISVVVLFDVDFAVLPNWTNGQIGQVLLGIFLGGLFGVTGGTLAVMILSLMFGGRL